MEKQAELYTFRRIKEGRQIGVLISIPDAKNLADAYFQASEFSEVGEELILVEKRLAG